MPLVVEPSPPPALTSTTPAPQPTPAQTENVENEDERRTQEVRKATQPVVVMVGIESHAWPRERYLLKMRIFVKEQFSV